MKITWINHKGKRIFSIDYSGLTEAEMLKQLMYGTELIMKETEPVLYLGNFAQATIFPEFMKTANTLSKESDKKISRMAVIGLSSGVRTVLLNAYNALVKGKMRAFKTEQEALDYLVQ